MTTQPSLKENNLFGAIDLGTNTCRLLISKCVPTSSGLTLEHIDSLSRVIRFGEHIVQTKQLSAQSIERAVIALEECQKRLSFHHVTAFRCVATAACRYAENTEFFVEEAFKKTGVRIEVITPEEESELAIAGCFELFDPKFPYVIVFDIGGGSTELVWAEIKNNIEFKILGTISFPYGFATLKEQLKNEESKEQITHFFSYEMNEFAIRHGIYEAIRQNKVQLIGASGTITTLAAIIMNLEVYDKTKVHEARLYKQNIDNVIRYLKATRYADRANHPCIGPQRADSIMGGIALFEAIYDIIPIEPIIAADRGVREGILYTLAKKHMDEGEKSKETVVDKKEKSQ